MAPGNRAARAQRPAPFGRRVAAIILTVGIVATGLLAFSPFTAARADALVGSSFNPGEIISDVVMYNDSTMTAAQIQAFLDTENPHCDTGATCLKQYTQTTSDYSVPSGYTQGVCLPYAGAANETAATIIYKIAKDCDVNPQVILVILQKEESLVTSPDPSSLTYRKAMGYGCPDTAACESDFYGFFKQVYWGARAMQRPVAAYKPGETSNILFSPNRACGTKTVTVLNKATSNLYTYTPYVPNRAALNNLTGTGDSCSSYGNRNFWVYFNSWFGSTVIPQSVLSYVQATYQDLLGRAPTSTELYSQGKYFDSEPSHPDFADMLLTGTEYRTDWVGSLYTNILKRPGTDDEITKRVNGLAKGTEHVRGVVDGLLAGNEYFTTQAGGTEAGWVTATYQYLLGRVPTTMELAAAKTSLGSDSSSKRLIFVTALYKTTESDTVIVSALPSKYLGRAANATDPTEVATLVAYLKKFGLTQTIAHVIGSPEYVTDAVTRFPATP